MKIVRVKGDIVDMVRKGEVDGFAHGANCFHTMGSGIARKLNALSNNELLKADCETRYGDMNKLGRISMCSFHLESAGSIRGFNLYTQYVHAGHFKDRSVANKSVLVNWDAFKDALYRMFCASTYIDRIAIPLIGCGLAGGDRMGFENSLMWLQYGADEDFPDKELVVVDYDALNGYS